MAEPNPTSTTVPPSSSQKETSPIHQAAITSETTSKVLAQAKQPNNNFSSNREAGDLVDFSGTPTPEGKEPSTSTAEASAVSLPVCKEEVEKPEVNKKFPSAGIPEKPSPEHDVDDDSLEPWFEESRFIALLSPSQLDKLHSDSSFPHYPLPENPTDEGLLKEFVEINVERTKLSFFVMEESFQSIELYMIPEDHETVTEVIVEVLHSFDFISPDSPNAKEKKLAERTQKFEDRKAIFKAILETAGCSFENLATIFIEKYIKSGFKARAIAQRLNNLERGRLRLLEYIKDAEKAVNLIARSPNKDHKARRQMFKKAAEMADYPHLLSQLEVYREARMRILESAVMLGLDLPEFLMGYTDEELLPYTAEVNDAETNETILSGELLTAKFRPGDWVALCMEEDAEVSGCEEPSGDVETNLEEKSFPEEKKATKESVEDDMVAVEGKRAVEPPLKEQPQESECIAAVV